MRNLLHRIRDIEEPVSLRLLAAVTAILAVSACGGGGGGGGTTASDPPPSSYPDEPPEPTLASIQENVFTPICTECHAGANAPQGLRLEAGMSYGMLVNVASSQVPDLDRVEPGDPDNSYLIRKLEGTASVGARMPFGGPYLEAGVISAIRQWITDGAPETSMAATSSKPVTMKSAWPVPGSTLDDSPKEMLLVASGELDTTMINSFTVSLYKVDVDPAQRIDDIQLRITSLQPTVIAVVPNNALPGGRYELRASGTYPSYIADRFGGLVDGDGDGFSGGDFSVNFQIEGR